MPNCEQPATFPKVNPASQPGTLHTFFKIMLSKTDCDVPSFTDYPKPGY